MYGEGVAITWTDIFTVLLVLTVPAQVALVVGSLSGLFLPGMKAPPGRNQLAWWLGPSLSSG